MIHIPTHTFDPGHRDVIKILSQETRPIYSFLNVGYRDHHDGRNHWWIKICRANSWEWHTIEAWQPNIDNCVQSGLPEANVTCADVIDTRAYDAYDVILFWAGPEHCHKDHFLSELEFIEFKANKLIIFGMPEGHIDNDNFDERGNPFEEHRSAWTAMEWQAMGYETKLIPYGKSDMRWITAWKRMGLDV